VADLKEIAAGRGYWIYMNSGASLTIKGEAASGTIELHKGWNLVGLNSLKTVDTPRALSSINGKYSVIYSYDSSANRYRGYSPSGMTELMLLEPGRGYWIYAEEDLLWSLPTSTSAKMLEP
jgi:hypothetical protein